MSLQTDAIFIKAIRSNSELLALLPEGDAWGTTITRPDVDLDNTPLPYVIVSFDGMQNDDDSKDDSYEGDNDIVQISIEVAASTRPELATIAEIIRSTIKEYFGENYDSDEDEDFALIPQSYKFSAGAVEYDAMKPCFWQVLHYSCDTNP